MKVYSESQTSPQTTRAETEIVNPPLHNVIPDNANPDVRQALELENEQKDRQFEEQQAKASAKKQGDIDIEKLRIALIQSGIGDKVIQDRIIGEAILKNLGLEIPKPQPERIPTIPEALDNNSFQGYQGRLSDGFYVPKLGANLASYLNDEAKYKLQKPIVKLATSEHKRIIKKAIIMDKEGDPQQSSELIAELPINVRYENNLPQSMTMGAEQPASISKDKLSRMNFLNGIYMPQYQKIGE